MATTNRIAATTLSVGGESAVASLSFASERLVLDFTAAQVGSDLSMVRLIVKDVEGRVVLVDKISGSDTQRSSIESGQVATAGALTAQIECLLGSAQVQLDEITGTAAFGTGSGGTQVQTADIAAGALAASAAGRAIMAANYFDHATLAGKVADDAFTAAEFAAGAGGKFAANCLVTAGLANLIADDAFTAAEFAAGAGGKFAANCLVTAGIQNLFAAGSMDGAACAHVFAAGAIPGASLAAGPFSLDTAIADPGNGANIDVTTSGNVSLNILGGGHNRGLPIPTIEGQVMMITHTAGANAGTVTSAQALDIQGTTVLNFQAALGQWVLLVGTNNGAALRWRVVAQGAAATNSVPVYVPDNFADPGAAGAIPVTASGRCTITIAGAGDNRSLAAPSFDGQILVIESLAGSAAGTVTVTNGFNRSGATVLNFQGGVNESITLVSKTVTAGVYRWRVLEDASGVSRWIGNVLAAGAIPVTYDDGIVTLNILAPADDRTLADASYVGQRLTLIHSAGANAGTVTAASDINPLVGGQNVINFTAGLAEMVVLEATSSLDWRIVTNPNGLLLT